MELLMTDPNKELSEIVELPVIIKGGTVQIADPDLRKLDSVQLKQYVKLLGGRVGYMKYRIRYERVSPMFCLYRGCWRPANDFIWCDDHPNGSPVDKRTYDIDG